MKKIILDTNFLLIPYTLKIDIINEIDKIILEPYTIYILEETLKELKKISQTQKGKDKEGAKFALKYLSEQIKKGKIEIFKQKNLYSPINSKVYKVDDIILEAADENTIVATQDKILKKKLAEKGIRTIMLKKKRVVEINVL